MRKSELKKLIEKIGLQPDKSLGQNFLASESIAERIVDAALLSGEDFVVELGPGLGIVTEKILDRGAEVLAVEIDPKLSSYLRKRFADFKNFHLIENDFFRLNKQDLISYKGSRPIKFISNPPYKGAKKILRKLSRMNTFHSVVITLQKAIADDLLIEPGNSNSSRLTYCIHYRFKPRKLFNIPMNFFFPTPSIDSSTILLSAREPHPKTLIDEFFFKTIDILLKNKRKKLKNNIKSGFFLSDKIIKDIMEKCKIMSDSRPTDLTLEGMVKLSNLLKETKQSAN